MIIISQFNIVVITAVTTTLTLVMIGNYYHPVLIYGQIINSDNNSNINKLDNNLSKKVKVEDIDISYKIFGKGDPILLIIGYAGSMNDWDPIFLKGLSVNHTVIVFDNGGIGNTTLGSKNFSINL